MEFRTIDRLIDMGLAQASRGYLDGAIDCLKNALTQDPDEPRAHAVLALLLVNKKRLYAADIEAGLALTLAPDYPLAHRAAAEVRIGQRKFPQAQEHIAFLLDQEPGDADHRLLQSKLHQLRGRRDDALAAAEEAVALAPDDPDVLASLAELRLDRGDVEAAHQIATDALTEEPEHHEALVVMGRILLRRGDVAGAEEHARWALRHDPSSQRTLYLFAAIKARKNWFLGLYWRFATWMGELGDGRSIAVLVGAYVAQRFLQELLTGSGEEQLASLVSIVWIGICIYTWVGPAMFARAVKKELEQVELGEY